MYKSYQRFSEQDRPLYHFTPESKWLNDPNGLLYYDGEYHLFHQYNCFGKVHWGHAVSTDLTHWNIKPAAIAARQDGEDWLQPWSGTAVIDWKNTSGLQKGEHPVFLAFFTQARQPGNMQSQSMAYSNDKGETWEELGSNPVVPNPGLPDFRDPKVFWHEETGRWIMVVVAGDHIKLYASPNALNWEYISEFGRESGSHGGVWECPDLFPMQVEGEDKVKWVLVISVGDGSPAGGTGMQYFIGHFDGTAFKEDVTCGPVNWFDYGQDFYAAISWNEAPDGRRAWVAWMSNWAYANSLPTVPYQGQLSIVRDLKLKRAEDGRLFIAQQPAEELKQLRKAEFEWKTANLPSPSSESMFQAVRSEAFEIEAELIWDTDAPPEKIELRVRKNSGCYTVIGYSPTTEMLYIDRSNSGVLPHDSFKGRQEVRRGESASSLSLRLFIDKQSVEVFADEGKYVLSDLIFPEAGCEELEWNIAGGQARIESCRLFPLRSAWPEEAEKPRFDGRAVSGQWAVTSQGIEGASAEFGMYLLPEVARDTELSVVLTHEQAFGEGSAAGLVFRMNPEGTRGYLVSCHYDKGIIGLYRLTAVNYEVVQVVPWEPSASGSDQIGVKATGRQIEISLNGQPLISSSEGNAYSEGQNGLYCRHGHVTFSSQVL